MFKYEVYPRLNNQLKVLEKGILVGYRWYATKKKDSLYCFGYGLSYTEFTYSDLKADKKVYHRGEEMVVSANIKNSGSLIGKEVVQLYVGKDNSTLLRADKELKAFKKNLITPAQTANATMKIAINDLAYFNTRANKFVVKGGNSRIFACSSLKNIREVTNFGLTIRLNLILKSD